VSTRVEGPLFWDSGGSITMRFRLSIGLLDHNCRFTEENSRAFAWADYFKAVRDACDDRSIRRAGSLASG
jgi:hypothetical protein